MIKNMSLVNENNDQLIPLFSSPVFVCSYQKNFDKELKWICNQNYISKDWLEEGDKVMQSSDTFILDNPELSSINVFLKEKISEYLNEIYESDDELVIPQSWLNKVRKGSSHPEHRHPNSIISGVWYPQINENHPVISFRSDSYQMTGHSNGHCIALKFKQCNNFNSGAFFFTDEEGAVGIISK